MSDVNKQLLEAVKHFHSIFDQYVSHHLAKPDYDKAAANERHRAICAEAIAAAEQARAEPSQQLTAVHVRAMAAGLRDGMGGHADACAELMEQLAKSMVAAEQAQQAQQAEPVAAQCRFEGEEEWSPCTLAHHLLVQAHPKEWPHYETRALYAQPPAVATDAISDAMEANAWRAALRGLCTGRELMTPDECAEHVRHRIESAKSCTKQPVVADVARVIWNIRREEEDRCDMGLEDMGTDHSVWREAEAVCFMLAAAPQGAQPAQLPPYDVFSDDDGDSWEQHPASDNFVNGLQLGDEFELLACWHAERVTFRVTKVPDDESDDYEVEEVTAPAAAQKGTK